MYLTPTMFKNILSNEMLTPQKYFYTSLLARNNYPCKNNGRITHVKHNVLTLPTTKFRRILPRATENCRMRSAPPVRANACN